MSNANGMKWWLTLAAIPALGLTFGADLGGASGASAPTSAIALKSPDVPSVDAVAYQQLMPSAPVAQSFSEINTLSLSLVAIPDPRVPRHRRNFDLTVAALIKGMLDNDYVLDRYGFPWHTPVAKDGQARKDAANLQSDCRFGVMLFRKDNWRVPNAGNSARGKRAPSFRALYLLPETATYGVARSPALAALRHMRMQHEGTTAAPVAQPECDAEATDIPFDPAMQDMQVDYATHAMCASGTGRVLMLGPTFSGSVDSLAQIERAAIEAGLPGLCAVSVSATSVSNASINRQQPPGNAQATSTYAVEFSSLAQSNDAKLAQVWGLAGDIGAQHPGKIAVFSEASTFGHAICAPGRESDPAADARIRSDAKLRAQLCNAAHRVTFPSSIADIRSSFQKKTSEKKSSLEGLGFSRDHIAIDGESENSSEFPDSNQTRLTSAGSELELDRSLRVLSRLKPKLVVIAATDVRDRLFLFDRIRDHAGQALLVDLEADILLYHPQHLHATRGAIAVASENLASFRPPTQSGNTTIGSFSFMSTDYQTLLRNAVSGIDHPGSPPWTYRIQPSWDCGIGSPTLPVLHVAGRNGLIPMTCAIEEEFATKTRIVPLLGLLALLLIALASPACAGTFVGWWHQRRFAWLDRWQAIRDARQGDLALNRSLFAIVPASLLLLTAAVLSQSGDALLLATLTVPVFGWAMAYQIGAYWHVGASDDASTAARSRWWRPMHRHFLLALALLLLIASILIVADASSSQPDLASVALSRLGYSTTNGMAIAIALMASMMALMFADTSLSTARRVSARNRGVVVDALENRAKIRLPALDSMFSVNAIPRSGLMTAGLLALALCTMVALPINLNFYRKDGTEAAIGGLNAMFQAVVYVKATVYGFWPSFVACMAVIALSFVALSFLANAVRIKRRALFLSLVVKSTVAMRKPVVAAAVPVKAGEAKAEAIGLWPDTDVLAVKFAATPAAARVTDVGDIHMSMLRNDRRAEFAGALRVLQFGPAGGDSHTGTGIPAKIPAKTRIALYVLFASEVSQIRWATFSSAICSLTVAAFAYFYPVSGADAFVLFNLVLLALTGLFAGNSATELERDEVMSNILCNRSSKLEVSSSLFRYIAFPFVVLAVMLAIVNVPGVLSWGDGLFKALLHLVGGGNILG